MEIKKRPQSRSKVNKGTSRKCSVCTSWKKKLHRTDQEAVCLTCYYREQNKLKLERAVTNAAAPVAPKIKIGKL